MHGEPHRGTRGHDVRRAQHGERVVPRSLTVVDDFGRSLCAGAVRAAIAAALSVVTPTLVTIVRGGRCGAISAPRGETIVFGRVPSARLSPTPRVTAMSAQDSPDTIVLIHGFWVTPRSWEDWIAHYEKKSFTVLAPAYPGFDVEVEALNADPTPIEQVTVAQIMERLEGVVGGLERPPILIGHSAGGVFTQLLMDRGYGAAGVAINSAPTEGVKRVPLSQVKASFPVLKNPANRHKAVGLTFEQWQYAFTNTFPEERGRELYERYHIPASGQHLLGERAGQHPSRQGRHLRQLQEPGSGAVAVHLGQRRPPHAADDPAVERQALQGRGHHHRGQGVHRTTPAAIDRGLGRGRRLRARLGAEPREDHRFRSCVTGIRVTHIGGPTVVIEAQGWRILTDPTFDPPGKTYKFGWGSKSTKLSGPALAPDDVGPVDAVLVSHDHHGDNLDDAGRVLLAAAPTVITTKAGPGGSAQVCVASIRGTSRVSKQPASRPSR